MTKSRIIFYDDDIEFYEAFRKLLDNDSFELITFESFEELRAALHDSNTMENVKVLVFDLARDTKEAEQTRDFVIIKDIMEKFDQYRIPIIIHSAFALEIEHFSNCGTVWKIEKSSDSIEKVVDIINNLNESGFLEVFTPGGEIEKTLMSELHRNFTEQFREGEIEKIINNIKGGLEFKDSTERIKKVFKRIAIRTLLSELLMPEEQENGNIKEETVNTVEHYFRRNNKILVWTGDIFKKNDSDNFLFIITPRCNVTRSDSILVCPFTLKEIIRKKDKITKMLQGDPTVSGYDRFLPPSPIFEGGKLSLSKYYMLEKENLVIDYTLFISLSAELTNEILGKFGSYFFRTGITPWDPLEVADSINNEK